MNTYLRMLRLVRPYTAQLSLAVVFMVVFALSSVFSTAMSRSKAVANPWGEGATTLEWTVPSPAPFHTHEELPVIGGGGHGHGHGLARPAE